MKILCEIFKPFQSLLIEFDCQKAPPILKHLVATTQHISIFKSSTTLKSCSSDDIGPLPLKLGILITNLNSISLNCTYGNQIEHTNWMCWNPFAIANMITCTSIQSNSTSYTPPWGMHWTCLHVARECTNMVLFVNMIYKIYIEQGYFLCGNVCLLWVCCALWNIGFVHKFIAKSNIYRGLLNAR